MSNIYFRNLKDEAEPFEDVQQAWFWFINANQAKNDGAQIIAGEGLVQRPCEPNDILNILNRLYRNRRLLIDHLRVLRFYGVRMMPPDPYRPKEITASKLWDEAMDMLEEIFISKGIVQEKQPTNYIHTKNIYSSNNIANNMEGYGHA